MSFYRQQLEDWYYLDIEEEYGADVVFCLEVFEYLYAPSKAIENIFVERMIQEYEEVIDVI